MLNTKFSFSTFEHSNRPISICRYVSHIAIERLLLLLKNKLAAVSASALRLMSKTARNNPRTALKPIAVEPLSELYQGRLPELPEYEPPLDLRSLSSKSIAMGLSELQTFQQPLSGRALPVHMIAKAREKASPPSLLADYLNGPAARAGGE
jgi:hypothetical protein